MAFFVTATSAIGFYPKKTMAFPHEDGTERINILIGKKSPGTQHTHPPTLPMIHRPTSLNPITHTHTPSYKPEKDVVVLLVISPLVFRDQNMFVFF